MKSLTSSSLFRSRPSAAQAGPVAPSWPGGWFAEERLDRVGFQYLIIVSDLQRWGWADDSHAARSYSWISPPRTLRRRIRAVAGSVTGAAGMSSQSGGRRFLARCGRCRL